MGCDEGMEFDHNPTVCDCVPVPASPTSCLDVDCPANFDCTTLLGDAACVIQGPG
jgi:hypothetical protein